MRIHPWFFGVMALAVFTGTILIFQSIGVWSVSGKTTASGEAVLPSAEDVDSIKGWMTLDQVSTVYHLPVSDILIDFNLPLDTPSTTAIKDLENDLFSVTNLRLWIENYTYTNQDSDSDGFQAVQSQDLLVKPSATPTPLQEPIGVASQEPIGHTITGKTTFQDLLDWGIDSEIIQTIISGQMPDPVIVIKDYCVQYGIEFASIKNQLQASLDQTQ